MTSIHSQRSLSTTIFVFLLLAVLLCITHPVFASDVVVGNGTPASCTGADFESALGTVQNEGGGTITFNCGTAIHTITIGAYAEISTSVTIDGGNLIALDGNNSSAFFQVKGTGALTITNLILQRGSSNDAAPYPLSNQGTLTLDNVTVQEHTSGFGVIHNGHNLRIQNSRFLENHISGVVFTSAFTESFGALTTILNTEFLSNSNDASDASGILTFNGEVSITGSRFVNNEGGPPLVAGINSITYLTDTEFLDNRSIGGGAIRMDGGVVVVNRSSFLNNHAITQGGAVQCQMGSLHITNTTFMGNESATNGGAIDSRCSVSIVNSTFTGNTAGNTGSALYQEGLRTVTIDFSTIVSNTALFGVGLYNDNSNGAVLRIKRSVVAHNSGGDCDGTITSEGYNLTYQGGCTFLEVGDHLDAVLPFAPIGDYGGSTHTLLPLPDNEAINAIPVVQCMTQEDTPTDQRGVPRPQGPGCDSGAVERAPQDDPTPTPTPTVTPTGTPLPQVEYGLFLPVILTSGT